ncbi:MAG TPA: undecaprenyl-phosphate glucose phosphotransferase [Aromatoleum sp.]|uniref:undecaprenyl-phosphate glucose phosphotransferase n=1 Tax=Aromatoleum sp. TaxID=2307007 RepID=UPI002B472E76|nr:undecaprenyl-phosphate glucose phosphotransferase [Aromatoleum sp.]HJV27110.1 undecaprenyl-phosphate glucose phosphotransferase [Aromatoleum sp.]
MQATLESRDNLLRGTFTLAGIAEAFIDPIIIVAVFYGSAAWHGERLLSPPYLVAGALAFSLTFPGNIGLHENVHSATRKVVKNWLLFVAIAGAFGYASGYFHYFPQTLLFNWATLPPLALIAAHAATRAVLPQWLARSNALRSAVVAGVNDVGLQLVQQFGSHPHLGTRVVGFFDDRPPERLPKTEGLPLLGRIEELADFVKRHHIDAVYLALPMATQPRILELLDQFKDTTASIYFVPDIFVTDLIQGRLDNLGGMAVVAVCETPFTGINHVVKRLSDIVLSVLILILLTPMLLAVAIGVKVSSPGPAIFRQKRYGLDGREIMVYKFRSMRVCENGGEIRQATRNDERVTRFGAFIRRTSLDELPQFINVLQGRMSIVGPRPHAVAHNEMYRKQIKGYMVRHKVKPGITGWAQVNGYRGETETVEKMRKRIEYDLDYLRNWSLGLDLRIIARTALLVVKDCNAY